MGNREILTLQFGHYSNYVGAHWWNIQEQGFEYDSSSTEVDHDVLYREGLTQRNEVTFTPRLLLVDLQGSLKTLPEEGLLYDTNVNVAKNADVGWDPDLVEVKTEPLHKKNEFQTDLDDPRKFNETQNRFYDFEKDVSVWSDFLYARFHPRTVNVIKEYQHCNENTPFDVFPLGVNLWKSPQFQEEFNDKIRNYIEECDSFQGFHVLTDCTNAFAGISSSCIQDLKDEYDRKSLLVFPVIPCDLGDDKFQTGYMKYRTSTNDSIRILNLALAFSDYTTYSSLYVPLSAGSKGWGRSGPKREFYHTVYNHELSYHSSAILASALDTFTLKYRLKSSNLSLLDLCTDLGYNGRKAAAASLCLPFRFGENDDFLRCLDNWQGPLSRSLTPNCEIGSYNLRQYVTVRGIPEEKLKQPPHLAQTQVNLPAYKCDNIKDMLSLYLNYSTESTVSNVTVVHKPLAVKTPYPRIFGEFVGENGYVCVDKRPKHVNVRSVPVFAGLHSGSGVGSMLESLYEDAKKIAFTKFYQFTTGGIEKDDYEESLETIITQRENYEDNYFI